MISRLNVLQEYSGVLVQTLISLLSDLKAEGVMQILRLVELVLKAFPSEGPSLFLPIMPSFLKVILEGEVSVKVI